MLVEDSLRLTTAKQTGSDSTQKKSRTNVEFPSFSQFHCHCCFVDFGVPSRRCTNCVFQQNTATEDMDQTRATIIMNQATRNFAHSSPVDIAVHRSACFCTLTKLGISC